MDNMYIANAFSLSMLDRRDQAVEPRIPVPVSLEEVLKEIADRIPFGDKVVSCVGHEPTAKILTAMTGLNIQVNRVNITLEKGITLFVAQYIGPRLPEGAVIEWWRV